jgi:serine/threonine protein kinase
MSAFKIINGTVRALVFVLQIGAIYGLCIVIQPVATWLFPKGGFPAFCFMLVLMGVVMATARQLWQRIAGKLLDRLMTGRAAPLMTEAALEGDRSGFVSAFREGVTRLGDYEIVGCLYESRELTTFAARKVGGLRVHAMKLPSALQRKDPTARRLLEREGRIMKSLSGLESCPQLLKLGRQDDGCPYILMRYSCGLKLSALRGEMTPAACRLLVLALGKGLGTIHRKGVVHGSLDLDKVTVDGLGQIQITGFEFASGFDKLAPFSAKLSDSRFLAPEQFEAGLVIDSRADVYALAGMTFELLTSCELQHERERFHPDFEMRELLKEVGLMNKEIEGIVAALSIERDNRPTLSRFLELFGHKPAQRKAA